MTIKEIAAASAGVKGLIPGMDIFDIAAAGEPGASMISAAAMGLPLIGLPGQM